MEQLEKYLYAKLDAMQTEKSAQKIEPCWVSKAELLGAIDKDIRATLNRWFKAKQIKVHKTIHAPIQDFVELVKEQ